ncbi:MAG TPA: error-prone DNA polymerase, partial [Candidatus Nitrosopolaris sp.]|nr:error-prone DNA polymerase [Candidatus Nitrosopolaris sp.]
FSFLAGASLPEDLIEHAARLGHDTLTLADRNGVYGAPRFFQAARRAGIRPLVGAEVRVTGAGHLWLLVESRTGYQHLCRLLTAAALGREKGKAEASWEQVEEHAAGLHCLAGGGEGPLAGEDGASHLLHLKNIFGECLAVDVHRHGERSGERLARRLADLATAHGVPVVATNDVRHATPGGRPLLDVLTCIHLGTTLDQAGRRLLANAERHLKSSVEMAALFRDMPEAIRQSRRIAERCAFTLADLGYRFPDFPLPAGETPMTHLRALTYGGARERYGTITDRVRRQLEHELGLIGRLKLAGYFLIVWDIVRYCRERGILVQGRGSAANSAVCYALGITAVDPIRMELLFERFLSEERGEWPDIDLDLPSGDRREDVIQYVYRRYGERGAAMTATVISYRTRSAVREAGKALGLSLEQVDRLAKLLRAHGYTDEHDELAAQLQAGGVDPAAPRIQLLVRIVRQMMGLPRHLGQHTGGMVIAAGRLDEVVPLEPAAMPGRNVIQWDKDDCADLGLIKVDLLGLGMLAALEEAIPLVQQHEGIAVDLAHLPPDDPAVYDMLQRADTIGVFQVESRAQMATLPRMRPRRFYDLVVEVAIIRPGPIVGQMVNPYLKRRAGREPIRYTHPTLEPILERTLGVPLFQEQLLRMAMTVAGFTGGEAEELRRAMGFKRSAERMQGIERRLREGMAARGITERAQQEIVQSITSFALYGFPESHAASFALIAYASAYLKAHHPAAFACALLNAWPMGFYQPATVVKDAQRHGVVVLPVDVVRSEWRCTIEGAGPGPGSAPRGGGALSPGAHDTPPSARLWAGAPTAARGTPRPRLAIRLGLRYVLGLRREAAERVVAGRPFTTVAGVAQAGGLRRDELEVLAHAGAFAAFGLTRRKALWQAAAVERDSSSLLARVRPPLADAPLPVMSAFEETTADYAATHLTAGPHIMAHLRDALRAEGVLAARDLDRLPNGVHVRVAGHVIVRQRPGTAKGMCFLTLEDETGTANAVVTPPLYERSRVVLNTSPLLEVAGRLERVDGVTHVRAARFRRLEAPTAMPEGHDYW